MLTSFAAFTAELALRRNLLAPLHREMSIDDDFILAPSRWNDRRLMQYFHGVPAEAKLKLLSLASDIVEIGLNQYIIGEHPSVKVLLPRGSHRSDKREDEHVRDLQQALDALLWQIDTYSTQKPMKTVGQHALGLGLGVLAYPLVWSRWGDHPMKLKDGTFRKPEESWGAKERKVVGDYEQRQQNNLIWDVHAEHPRRVFFDLHHDPPEDVILETAVLPGIYLERYPHLQNINSRAKTATLKVFCSRDEYGLWLNNQSLLTKKDGVNTEGFAKNRTGILWYRMAEGGFGYQAYENEWQYRIQGVVRAIRPVIVSKMISFNIIDIVRQVYGIPPIGVEAETLTEAIEAAGRIEFGMGAVWPHTARERQHKLDLPELPKAVFDQLSLSDDAIEMHAWPEVLKGVPLSGGETATGGAQRLSQGKASLRVAGRNLAQVWEGALMDICHMVKYEIKEPITLFSEQAGLISLDPDDIVDGMRITINLAPATAEEKAFQRREELVLLDKGLRSRETILIDDPDVLDPEEEMARILSDRAMESEAVVAAIAQEATQHVLGGTQSPAGAPAQPSGNGAASPELLAPSETMQTRNPTPGLPPLTRGY